VRRLPVIPVIGPGSWHLRPVFRDDLIDLVVATLARPELAGRSYDVGGPDLVTYNEFLAAICRALGRRCRRVRLPIGVSFVLASVLEHMLPVHPETELVGFVDRDVGLADHLASQGLGAPLHPSIEALYGATNPDAVFICTPTHTHLAVVRECLARPVHLFVEKPLATSRADAEAILRLASDARVMHAAGYVYAHLPVVQAAHELVAKGVLGEVLRFTA